jgi:hypothetical protein
METVKSARYSFTVASVSAARVSSENFLYEASLYPFSDDPFWQGHLKKFQIAADEGDHLSQDAGQAWDKRSFSAYIPFWEDDQPFNTTYIRPAM